MKKYTLQAVVDGQLIQFDHKFDSRVAALNYIYAYYARRCLDFVVNDEYRINNDKHNIEYVCDYENRFRISRTII